LKAFVFLVTTFSLQKKSFIFLFFLYFLFLELELVGT